MRKHLHPLRKATEGEEGATMVEYGLMLALIAIVAMAGAALIGTSASTLFSTTANTL